MAVNQSDRIGAGVAGNGPRLVVVNDYLSEALEGPGAEQWTFTDNNHSNSVSLSYLGRGSNLSAAHSHFRVKIYLTSIQAFEIEVRAHYVVVLEIDQCAVA